MGDFLVILKVGLHCKCCLKRLCRSVERFEGVEEVFGDIETNKLAVRGKFEDPVKLKAWVESKIINKEVKVELISAKLQPKNESEDQSSGDFFDQTVLLKTPLHCQGCIEKIQKIINKTKGIEEVSIGAEEGMVTVKVKGKMDRVKALQSCLHDKLKRVVDIVPPHEDSSSCNDEDSSCGCGCGCGCGGVDEGVSWGGFSDYYGPLYFSEEDPDACSNM